MMKACDYKNAKREVLIHGVFFHVGNRCLYSHRCDA